MDKIIINNYNICSFTGCNDNEVENALQRAVAFYQKDLQTYKSHLIEYPEMADHWRSQIETIEKILSAGFRAVTFEEYQKLERQHYMSTIAKEIDRDTFNYALNCLPPVNWIRTENISMFHISEADRGTLHGNYLHDKTTGKYYFAVTDIYDRSTWIDKILNL